MARLPETENSFQHVDSMMRRAVSVGVFPGAVLLASIHTSIVFHRSYGFTDSSSESAVSCDTVFDLASLTKPLATAPTVMKMVEKGELDLDAPLGSIMPVFHQTDKSHITLRHLLCHRSGLPDYRPYYDVLKDTLFSRRRSLLLELLVEEPLINKTGEKTVYSDLGFMILSRVVETICADRLDRIVSREIYRALDNPELFYVDLRGPLVSKDFAATERCPWREKTLRGEVHDDNAWVVGGIDGHAGLFGTAAGVHRVLVELLTVFKGASGTGLLSTQTVHALLRRTPGQDRTPGFDTPAKEGASCGRWFSADSVGHLGFTGTSFWMDLAKGIIVILLTNRVHPTRENTKIRDFRPKLHDAVMENIQGSVKRYADE